MPKKSSTVVTVMSNKIHVQIHAVDYEALEVFTVTMTYKELEEFARKHGEKDQLNKIHGKISNAIRESLES